MTNIGGGGERVASAKSSLRSAIDIKKRKPLLVAIILAISLLLIITLAQRGQTARSESYKEVAGAAGLNAAINYDCTDPCENKYGFNVYILTPDGRQVSVVRPSSDGDVKLALAEGNYVMLIGKLFGDKNIFPQEPLELKNGKTLELKLQY